MALGIGALLGAGIQGATSLIGASMQANASKKASQLQAIAAQKALEEQQRQFGIAQNNLAPFMQAGSTAAGRLNDPQWTANIPLPDAPLPLTQAELEATPGYSFTLGQGLKATQNSAAARGLGLSGAALKGAATYATGLSDQTYNTRFGQRQQEFGNRQTLFQDAVTNRDAGFNKLYQAAGLGANAAGGLATVGQQNANASGNILMAGGQAQAAGVLGPANAWTSGLTGVGNALMGASFNPYAQSAIKGLFSPTQSVPSGYELDPLTGRPVRTEGLY